MVGNTPRIDKLDKNYIINGNFDFWQRGTSLGVTGGSSSFLADRFKFWSSGTNNISCHRDADVPTLAQSGTKSSYSMKFVNQASIAQGATDYVYYENSIEGTFLRDLIGETCTISFWMKSSVVGDYTVALLNLGDDWKYITKATVLVADTWEKKNVTIEIGDSVPFILDNSSGMRVAVWLKVGTDYQTTTENIWTDESLGFGVATQANWCATSGNTCYFSQMKLSKGKAQEFSMAGRDFAEELQLCQRYFEKSSPIDVDVDSGGSDGAVNWQGIATNTYVGGSTDFKVEKRVVPVMLAYNGAGTVNRLSVHNNWAGSSITFTSWGLVGRTGFGKLIATPIAVGTWYMFQWTADAEL